jgi:hypothetical protein
MRIRRLGMVALAALLPLPALAQVQEGNIVVQGSLEKKSDWNVAETDHVIVFSDGSKSELTRIAHNLERLHFLLSVLLNRVDQLDESAKLRVTLVRDTAQFEAMELRNTRSEQGPFARAFRLQRYYDPREDGAVMAGASGDMSVEIEPSARIDIASLNTGMPVQDPMTGQFSSPMFSGSNQIMTVTTGGNVLTVTGESRIYAGFAQHYLLTYFPAAYPRWYLDGFGEMFSSIRIRPDGALEYGHMPLGYRKTIEAYGQVPVKDVLSGKYLETAKKSRWTPFHAWVLTHYLFFSEVRRPQLSRYLADIAKGASLPEAAKIFGSPEKLQAEVTAYDNRALPYDRMTYPQERAPEPIVQALNEGQARFLKAASSWARGSRFRQPRRRIWTPRPRRPPPSCAIMRSGRARTGGSGCAPMPPNTAPTWRRSCCSPKPSAEPAMPRNASWRPTRRWR